MRQGVDRQGLLPMSGEAGNNAEAEVEQAAAEVESRRKALGIFHRRVLVREAAELHEREPEGNWKIPKGLIDRVENGKGSADDIFRVRRFLSRLEELKAQQKVDVEADNLLEDEPTTAPAAPAEAIEFDEGRLLVTETETGRVRLHYRYGGDLDIVSSAEPEDVDAMTKMVIRLVKETRAKRTDSE